ncbi:Hypothetical protein D9617_24g016150 [Elsinoe fawcettii]|nr:Hypothetical protein D9617_24g016150 [Elsinoe fawcettii]
MIPSPSAAPDTLSSDPETLYFSTTLTLTYTVLLSVIPEYIYTSGLRYRIWPHRSRLPNVISSALSAALFSYISGDIATIRSSCLGPSPRGWDCVLTAIFSPSRLGVYAAIGFCAPDALETAVAAAREERGKFFRVVTVAAALMVGMAGTFAVLTQATAEVVGYGVVYFAKRGDEAVEAVVRERLLKSVPLAMGSAGLVWMGYTRLRDVPDVVRVVKGSSVLRTWLPGVVEGGDQNLEKDGLVKGSKGKEEVA